MAVRALTGMFKSRQSRSASSMHVLHSMKGVCTSLRRWDLLTYRLASADRTACIISKILKLSLWWSISQSISAPVLCPREMHSIPFIQQAGFFGVYLG